MRIRLKFLFFLIVVTGLWCGSAKKCYAQISGLGFNSYGVTKDLRTGIDLFPQKPLNISDDFDLSFRFRLRKGESTYFGYVFRLVSGDNNFDLIFNYDGPDVTYFTLVQGQKLLARVNSDYDNLCSDWNSFDFKFNLEERSVTVKMLNEAIKVNDLEISKGKGINIYFGLCKVGNFKTTDVPGMDLRDISIADRQKVRHHWPLNEMTGQVAKDISGKSNAIVINPLWLKSEHFTWKEIFSKESEGYMWCTFDSKKDEVVIINQQNIIKLAIGNNRVSTFTPKNSNYDVLATQQAVYDTVSDRVYLLNIDKPSASIFDFKTGMWSGDLEPAKGESDFIHYNKFFSATDTSVYFFGGYGHHQYKNIIQKFNLNRGKLVTLNPGGDFFNPRYLAGLGRLNDTIYIIGGFGSNTGEQILNPHSYSDLISFSLKNHTFHKKFDIDPKPEDRAFSNSIIIDPADRSYYGLIFPIFSYNGYLQLIRGSLDSSGYKVLGSRIPFQFSDIVSFSDLYFSRQNNKLIAVTIKNENGKSQLKVLTLSFPPDQHSEAPVSQSSNGWLIILLILVLLLAASALALKFLYRRKKPETGPVIEIPRSEESPSSYIKTARPNTCYLHFFGDFQVINESGKDITRKFTPLLKELFLLIWLNSIKNDIGISNEKIVQTLWHDFPESSAQNNKAVNIAKLRAILSENFSCTLTYKNTGYWRIDYKNRNVINDYYEFIKITSVKSGLSRTDIMKLVEFSLKGQFLGNLKYGWLEEYKVAVSNEIINRLVQHLRTISLKEEPEHVIEIADAILKVDNLNEEAMQNKCRGLITLGRHTVAKEVYDLFVREYRILYNVEYEKSFTSIAGQM